MRKSLLGYFAWAIVAMMFTIFPLMLLLAGQNATATVAVARAIVEVANDRPQLPDQGPRYQAAPLVMSLAKSAIESEPMPAQLVVEMWESGCPHCVRQERDIHRVLGKLGWTIGNAQTDQIQFVIIPQTAVAPQSVLYQNGVEIKRWEGWQDPAFLSNELRKAWETSPTPSQTIAASGSAGAIQGQAQIRQVIEWVRANIGEGVQSEIRWDRSGAQSFPLLAKGDWSAVALFGKFGHVSVSAIGAKNLPIQSLGFTYTVAGDDISIDLDAIMIKGLALKVGPQSSPMAGSAPVPSQFGIMTAWTIVAIVRDIWSVLHPTCDLQLGGNVSATAVLTGDVLTVEFQQCPSIRLVALFTFNLGVKRVVITDANVHVDFTGSRLVKSRDFAVQ